MQLARLFPRARGAGCHFQRGRVHGGTHVLCGKEFRLVRTAPRTSCAAEQSSHRGEREVPRPLPARPDSKAARAPRI